MKAPLHPACSEFLLMQAGERVPGKLDLDAHVESNCSFVVFIKQSHTQLHNIPYTLKYLLSKKNKKSQVTLQRSKMQLQETKTSSATVYKCVLDFMQEQSILMLDEPNSSQIISSLARWQEGHIHCFKNVTVM